MLNKKCLGVLVLAGAAISTVASADDRGLNTVAGAVIGAAIGQHSGSRNGAVVGGLVGAAIGSSLSNGGYYERGYAPAPVAYAPVYAPSGYYAAPPVVYYEPARRYYAPREVVYVERGRGHERDYYEHGRGEREYRR